MVTIPQKLHDVLAGGHNSWVATVGPDGALPPGDAAT
jgi:hypothetical protein